MQIHKYDYICLKKNTYASKRTVKNNGYILMVGKAVNDQVFKYSQFYNLFKLRND